MAKPLLIAWDFYGVLNIGQNCAPVLQAALDRHAEQIIISHSSRDEINTFLEREGYQQYFTHIFGAEDLQQDISLGKSPTLTAFAQENGPYQHRLIIGDSPADIADGKKANYLTCLFDPNGFYKHGAEADFVISNLHHVDGILSQLQESHA